jgi:hypothetical protein
MHIPVGDTQTPTRTSVRTTDSAPDSLSVATTDADPRALPLDAYTGHGGLVTASQQDR